MCSYVWLFLQFFFFFFCSTIIVSIFLFCFAILHSHSSIVRVCFFFFGSFKLWVCLGTVFHKIREISVGKLSLLQKFRRRLILQKIASAVKVSNREEIE